MWSSGMYHENKAAAICSLRLACAHLLVMMVIGAHVRLHLSSVLVLLAARLHAHRAQSSCTVAALSYRDTIKSQCANIRMTAGLKVTYCTAITSTTCSACCLQALHRMAISVLATGSWLKHSLLGCITVRYQLQGTATKAAESSTTCSPHASANVKALQTSEHEGAHLFEEL